jgi:hypothetical protein
MPASTAEGDRDLHRRRGRQDRLGAHGGDRPGGLVKQAPGLERFGLESGATSAWLWRELQRRGLPPSASTAVTHTVCSR